MYPGTKINWKDDSKVNIKKKTKQKSVIVQKTNKTTKDSSERESVEEH